MGVKADKDAFNWRLIMVMVFCLVLTLIGAISTMAVIFFDSSGDILEHDADDSDSDLNLYLACFLAVVVITFIAAAMTYNIKNVCGGGCEHKCRPCALRRHNRSEEDLEEEDAFGEWEDFGKAD